MSGDSNARVFLMCNAKSSFGPPGFLCNNNTTVPLRLGAGNDFTIDADGWSVMFDEDDEPIVRCPKHADQRLTSREESSDVPPASCSDH